MSKFDIMSGNTIITQANEGELKESHRYLKMRSGSEYIIFDSEMSKCVIFGSQEIRNKNFVSLLLNPSEFEYTWMKTNTFETWTPD